MSGTKFNLEMAYRRAEAAIKMHLMGRYDDHLGYHHAVMVVSEFASEDPSVVSGRQALLKEVVAAKIMPGIARQAAIRFSPAR